jgi:ferredoxin
MLELVDRSRELGLVMNAENVQKNTGFVCHCCACCCNLIGGITQLGYSRTVVSSSLAAEVDPEHCRGCGQCVDRCPFGAIALDTGPIASDRRHGAARVDAQTCLGCGVCVPKCARHALRLVPRRQRVLHPETTFERVILMALERGSLQALVFDHPDGVTQEFLRGFLGGFLRLSPVKRALVGERLRSLFLGAMRRAARAHASNGPAHEL